MTSLPKLEEMTDILDIKGIQIWDWTYYWVALGILLALLLGYFGWHLWRRRSGRALGTKPLRPIERALQRLEELTQRGFLEGGRVRLFFFNLSEIFRDFLEEELGMKASEATLEELKPLIKACPDFTQEEIVQANWFLELSDMAKFARYVPPKEDIIQSVKTCRTLMEALARRRTVTLSEEAKMVISL
jgi:hypothetical protein